MTYEAWRISYQSSEQAARAAYSGLQSTSTRLHEAAVACANAEAERDALRAKVAEMEKQEPVGEIRRANSTGNYINPVVWVPMAVGAKLYAGPGAKGEEK